MPKDFFYYLSMHEDCSGQLLHRAEGLEANEIDLSSDPKLILIRKMVSSVLAEIYRMKNFVRLTPLGDQALYGYLKPRHKIGSDISRFLSRRSPSTIIILGNSLECWISLYTGGEVLQTNGPSLDETVKEMRHVLNSEDTTHNLEEIWKIYYSSQYSPERRNMKAFHKRMPVAALNSTYMEVEQNNNGVTLDDFFGSD